MGIDAVKPRAVFLDRDGVLNRAVVRDGKPYPPATVDDLEILPGAAGALARLKAAGYALVVVTNQPDIARGTTTRAAVDAIHTRLAALLPIDEFRVCPHDDSDACACRKPRPGLLVDPPTNDVAASVMVGDRWRDIEAGRAAGCAATVLIDYQYDEQMLHEPDARVASLSEAAAWILTRPRRDDLIP
jgi:D-glycero-D-manno-heptose 1,7-bisphosphate phosphatase